MSLSEQLYTLRRRSGLSQEQLAEKLGVSRQAVSKWESGASTPESEKLIAISRYFNVTVDHLINGTSVEPSPAGSPEGKTSHPRALAGLIICLAGVAGIILWGLVTVLSPAASNRLGDSSAITIDGHGILLLLCAAALIAGAVLLLRDHGKK